VLKAAAGQGRAHELLDKLLIVAGRRSRSSQVLVAGRRRRSFQVLMGRDRGRGRSQEHLGEEILAKELMGEEINRG
jgi:hypothetical protein